MKIALFVIVSFLSFGSSQSQKVSLDCGHKLDLGILLDASGSIGFSDYLIAKHFVKTLVDEMDISPGRDHFGLINYDSFIHVVQTFNPIEQSKENIKRKIDNIVYTGGTTATAQALSVARTSLFNEKRSYPVKGVAIVITDGYSDEGLTYVAREADLLKKSGVEIICVGVGIPKSDELLAMASSQRNIFLVASYPSLINRLSEIKQAICETGDLLPNSVSLTYKLAKGEKMTLRSELAAFDPATQYLKIHVVQLAGSSSMSAKDSSGTNLITMPPSAVLENGIQVESYVLFPKSKEVYLTFGGNMASNTFQIRVDTASYIG